MRLIPPVVVALDFSDLDKALALAAELRPLTAWYKVGCQLFARYGHEAVRGLVDLGCQVFVDLKVNGHPETDHALGCSIARWRVQLVDIHLSLGDESIHEFLKGLESVPARPRVLGVTVLTSHAGVSQFGVGESRREVVLRLASRAKAMGLDGVVAAASDVRDIKDRLGRDFLVVTPGIRPLGAPTHEQKQVATPFGATKAGADFLVVGRPITEAPHPRRALEAILEEVKLASSAPAGCECILDRSYAYRHPVAV